MMIFAIVDGKLTEAAVVGPKRGTCVFCGELVEASVAPMALGPMWFHLTDYDAARCRDLSYGESKSDQRLADPALEG
jgi:hypothetical protein